MTVKKVVMTVLNDNVTTVQDIHYEIFVDPSLELLEVESEIIGVKTELIKISPSKYTLIIKSMKPKSQMVLFLNYAKAT